MYNEKTVDAYILRTSKLKPTSDEYQAIKTLLETGNLLYCVLGKWETLEMTKILIEMHFRYDYVTGGIKLKENSKTDFYNRIINYQPPAQNYSSTRFSVGKEERPDKIGWAEQILVNKNNGQK